MRPDELALRGHLQAAEFQLGVGDGRWRVIGEISWPFVNIAVTARDGSEFPFRFDCSGFPQGATARLWDPVGNAPLPPARWPKSQKGGRVAAVFRTDWKGGAALYLPCDRVSRVGHDNWVSQVPSKLWKPERGLVHYLEQIHELLHCSDYAPVVRAAS